MTDIPAALRVAATPRAWPTVGPVAPERVALLSIDFQADFVSDDAWLARIGIDTAPMRAILPQAATALDAARAASIHVVHTRQGNAADCSDIAPFRQEVRGIRNRPAASDDDVGLVRGTRGWEIVDAVAPVPGEMVIDKTGFSAFEGTALDAELRARSIEVIVVMGVTTNVCVLATLLGAIDRGYDTLVLTDAVAADDPAITDATIRIVEHEGSLFGARATVDAFVAALTAR